MGDQIGNTTKSNGNIALCLSGGGLRATLFHLGVVKALRISENGQVSPLSRVTEIFSVSGGSIIAVHMLTNWDRYSGSDEQFAEVERELISFAGRNMRDRILRRWVLSRPIGLLGEWLLRLPGLSPIFGIKEGTFSRTYWLQREYNFLTKRQKFGIFDNGKNQIARPTGHFLTTSFTTGELCSFSGTQFEIELRNPENEATLASAPCGHMPLSFAVAASSAFPPMFPPITLTDDMLANPINERFLNSLSLSDGGVFDNLGIEKFNRICARNKDHPSTLLISDAGGSFRSGDNKSFRSVVSRNIRASDILMHRVGDDAKATINAIDEIDDITIRISTIVEDQTLEPSIQQRLRMVRTDLDRFSPELANMLIEHGSRVAQKALREHHVLTSPDILVSKDHSSADVDNLDRIARNASSRSFTTLLTDFRDWTLVPLLVISLGILLSTGFYVNQYNVNKQANERADKLQAEADEQFLIFTLNNNRNLLARSKAQERILEQAIIALTDKDYVKLGSILQNSLNTVGAQITTANAGVKTTENELSQSGVISTDSSIKQDSQPTNLVHNQKVYIQFAGLLTREAITNLNNELRAQGWAVQGTSGERLAVASGLNEVRFSGSNEAAAKELAAAINASNVVPDPVVSKKMAAIGAQNLEVWISR